MSPPRVSVLMSVRNGAPYLGEAMDSVFAQSFDDFEFIVIDNGSTDETPGVIDRYPDPRLKRLRNPESLTLTEALNQGLAAARGAYVARLDADDIAIPTRLEKQVAFMDAKPGVAASGARWIEFDDQGEERLSPPPPSDRASLLAAIASDTPFVHSALIFRRQMALDVGGYPGRYAYGQDYGLYLALLAAGHELAVLAEPLVRIRIHPGQASLAPEWAVLRSTESLELYARAADIPGLDAQGRARNRRRVAACRLQRALALWRAGQRAGAIAEAARGWAGSPQTAFAMTRDRIFANAG